MPATAMLGLALLAPACKTPAAYRAEADAAVYEIVAQRRAELSSAGPFSIEAQSDTLRSQLLAGVEVGPLAFDDMLLVAAENSRGYQSRREELYRAALDLTLERWRLSVQPTVTGEGLVRGSGKHADTETLMSTLGLSKLVDTGLSIVGELGLDLVRDLTGASRGHWNAVSRAALSITQPLMRGSGSDIVRESLTQAERDVLYEARVYERFRRTFAFQVAQQFFDVLQQTDTLANEQENHQGLQRLLERNESFADAGRLNEIEVDQARQDELRARNRVIDAERSLQSQLDGFKFFLGLPVNVVLPIAPADVLTIERWPFLALDPSEDHAVAVALARRLDHATALDSLQDAERHVHVAEDALRAGLDLFSVANQTSRTGEPDDASSDDMTWTLGLDLDLAIDRLPERNAYRRRLMDLEVARRSVEASADGIVTDVRAQRRNLVASRESYEIQQSAVELAGRRVESSQLNLEAGRASTRDVLESQEDLVVARNALTSALTSYILSGLALYRDMELLRVGPDGVTVDTAPLSSRTETIEP